MCFVDALAQCPLNGSPRSEITSSNDDLRREIGRVHAKRQREVASSNDDPKPSLGYSTCKLDAYNCSLHNSRGKNSDGPL